MLRSIDGISGQSPYPTAKRQRIESKVEEKVCAYTKKHSFFTDTEQVLLFPAAGCNDIFKNIALHLDSHNPYLSALSSELAALAPVSKKWNNVIYDMQIFAIKEHARLKSQESLLLDSRCQTAEEAISFVVKNKLEVANFEQFTDLTDLTDELLEKLFKESAHLKHLIIKSRAITQLPEGCCQLQTLKCDYCYAVTHLPSMPELINLSCRSCIELTSLPSMPKLTALNCRSCIKLVSLPPMLSLKKLNCEYCSEMIALSHMPHLLELNMEGCEKFISLPNLTSLIKLKCNKCKQITSLPSLPKLLYLDCSDCIRLITLSDMPKLKSLNCSFCYELTSLSDMPKVTHLDCTLCPKLTQLPYLPDLKSLNTAITRRF